MNLKGGYKIIDLSSMSLVVGTDEYIQIEDVKILNQLLDLKEFLDDSKDLKPIYLRAITTSYGKEVVMGELSKLNSGLSIKAYLREYELDIYIEFTQDEETQEILIDYASYLYVQKAVLIQQEVIPALRDVESGDVVEVLGYDSNDDLVKGTVSGEKIFDFDFNLEYDDDNEVLTIASDTKGVFIKKLVIDVADKQDPAQRHILMITNDISIYKTSPITVEDGDSGELTLGLLYMDMGDNVNLQIRNSQNFFDNYDFSDYEVLYCEYNLIYNDLEIDNN